MLTAVEIRKQEFSRAVRGYDVAEVRSYLDAVADEIKNVTETAHLRASEIERLKSELETYRRMDQNMKEALVNTQETLREAKEGTRREAEIARKEAEVEAEKIIQDAHKKGEDIRLEVKMLKERRDSIIRKLKALLRSELDLIDLLEDEEIESPPKFVTNHQMTDNT